MKVDIDLLFSEPLDECVKSLGTFCFGITTEEDPINIHFMPMSEDGQWSLLRNKKSALVSLISSEDLFESDDAVIQLKDVTKDALLHLNVNAVTSDKSDSMTDKIKSVIEKAEVKVIIKSNEIAPLEFNKISTMSVTCVPAY